MDEKYQALIEALATKLGTTAEHLWSVLVRQAPISGVVDLVLCIVIATVTVLFVALIKHKTTAPEAMEENRYPHAEWRDEAAFLAWAVALIAGVFALVYVTSSAQGIAAAFANPEYWALKQLVK